MRNNSKKFHLRWLVPLLIYYVVLALLLVSYRNYLYEHAVRDIEFEMAFAIEREIDQIDYSVGQAMTAVSEAGEAFSLYAMRYNQFQIESLMKKMVNDTDLTTAMVCNLEGSGYDYMGKDVHLGKEEVFSEITNEYSRGGLGMILPVDNTTETLEAYIVNGISFDKKERGYLIAKIPVISVADQIFSQKFEADTIAIISIDGQILSMNSKGDTTRPDTNFFLLLPPGITKESVKLSISQKNIYYADAPGFGYYLVVPLDTVNGGAVALIDYDDMKSMANTAMVPFKLTALWILIASFALIVLTVASYVISDEIVKRRMKKSFTQSERDVLTNLLTMRSALKEIDDYIEGADGKRGMLFVVGLDLMRDPETKAEEEISPDRIKDFAGILGMSFRSTDIIGRSPDNEFLVFLKDICEEKDIRKQTDHMQMFLHDVRMLEGENEITTNAGAALCPDNGRNAKDLLASARLALERAREEGAGRMSF